MGCILTPTQLLNFQLDDLKESERMQIRRHLMECQECLSHFLQVKEEFAVAGHVTETPGNHLYHNITRQIFPTPFKWEGLLNPRLTLALAVALILAGLVMTALFRSRVDTSTGGHSGIVDGSFLYMNQQNVM